MHAFGGQYLELLPHERIRYADKFDAPHLPGARQESLAVLAKLVESEIPDEA